MRRVAIALLAGACLTGCVAVPAYGPGYGAGPYGQPAYGPGPYGQPAYGPGPYGQPAYGPPVAYAPAVVVPSIGFNFGFGGRGYYGGRRHW